MKNILYRHHVFTICRYVIIEKYHYKILLSVTYNQIMLIHFLYMQSHNLEQVRFIRFDTFAFFYLTTIGCSQITILHKTMSMCYLGHFLRKHITIYVRLSYTC